MTRIYSGSHALFGNVLASVDLETTGKRPGYHEIVQIGIVPLNGEFEPHPEIPPFYHNIAPNFPERAEPGAMRQNGLSLDDLLINAPSQETVLDLLNRWFEAIDLPIGKMLVPLAHNWPFENGFLGAWMGIEAREAMWHGVARDSMMVATYINDRAVWQGDPRVFEHVNLPAMCKALKIVNERPHDALHDSLAAAKVWKALIQMGVL